MKERNDPVEIEIPLFDDRAIRRAVRRAIARTVSTALGVVLALALIVSVTSTAWSARGSSRLVFVMGRAYQAANPGYQVNFSVGRRTRPDFRTDLIGIAYPLEPSGSSASGTEVTIRRSFTGRVSSATGLTPTHIDEVFFGAARSDKDRASRLLEGLPRSIAISALVELKEPLDQDRFTAFRHRIGICGRDQVLPLAAPTNVLGAARRLFEERRGCGSSEGGDRAKATLASMVLAPRNELRLPERLTWPDFSLVEFRGWAAELRDSDTPNLRKLLLPDVAQIKRRAREGKIYGFIVTSLRRERLATLLKAPELADITITDVDFALD